MNKEWIVGTIFSSQQGKRKTTAWDGQSCMILISLRLLANPFFTSLSPFILPVLQGKFWCTASWEWAGHRPWFWHTSWSTIISHSNRLCRSWSRKEPSTPTGISWLCCWIWIFSWQRKRKHVGSCSEKRHVHLQPQSYAVVSGTNHASQSVGATVQTETFRHIIMKFGSTEWISVDSAVQTTNRDQSCTNHTE